jgi:hypothetical protein
MAGEKSTTLNELEEIEYELLHAADTWFSAHLHRRLQRLIEIAKLGQRAMNELADLRHEHGPPNGALV